MAKTITLVEDFRKFLPKLFAQLETLGIYAEFDPMYTDGGHLRMTRGGRPVVIEKEDKLWIHWLGETPINIHNGTFNIKHANLIEASETVILADPNEVTRWVIGAEQEGKS